jgi:hypothetical protein
MTNEDPKGPDKPRGPRRYPPKLPQHPAYIPGYAAIPLARFFVDLLVHPTSLAWLAVACLVDGVAVFLAFLAALGIVQTNGLSWWSVGVVMLVAALLAGEVVCFRAWRRRAAE